MSPVSVKRSSRSSASVPVSESNPNVVTAYRWGWYGLSFFIPMAGILIGLFLYDQDSREVRKVGRNCLFIGFFIWVVIPVLFMLVVAVLLLVAAAGWLADMMPAGTD